MSEAPFIIRPWRDGDEIALTRLFHRTFGRPITPDHWRWKLRPEPTGFDNVWLAFSENEGEPIFQYAGIPLQFNLDGKPVQAVVSVDTMTAPEFRRRGLLTQVAQKAYSAWRAADVACVIGLPNENWGTRAQALGWRSLFPLQWLVRPVRPQAILAARMKWPALKHLTLMEGLWNFALESRVRPSPDIHLEQVEQAGPEFDQIWARCKTDWAFSTVRDRRWVNWRFISAPARTYRLLMARRQGEPTGYLSYAIVHTADRISAYLAEVCAERADKATRDSLLAGALELVRKAEAESVHVLAIPGTVEFAWLRRAGFLPSHAFEVQFVPLLPDLPLERMLDRQQWNLSGADFDVV
jgi:hypothetical protein